MNDKCDSNYYRNHVKENHEGVTSIPMIIAKFEQDILATQKSINSLNM